MKLVNKSARPYSIHGTFVIPGGGITLDDDKLPDVQLFIDIGDLVEVKDDADGDDVKEEKKKPGRKPKTDE